MLNRIAFCLFMVAITGLTGLTEVVAQTSKIGFVDLERIRQSYKGFKDAQGQFQKSVKDSQDKVRMMEEELTGLKQRYEARKMMLTDTKRQEDERLIIQKEQELMQYIQVQQQELAQREMALTRPLTEKILGVVETIATAENYTYVLDASTLIYIDPVRASDLTGKILEELEKEVK
jgi:outer membrane protein